MVPVDVSNGDAAIFLNCFQIHSATKIETRARRESGNNGKLAGEPRANEGNFSRAKYHADWLEVMKF